MSKAEDKAKEFLNKLASHTTLYNGTIDELEVYEPDDVICAYKEGYQQAEKHLALTWEDINRIEIIIKDVYRDYPHGIEAKQFGIEVLNRFNKQKGE